MGGVTLKDIMAQLVNMDARLNTLSDELCQVNTRVGCIAWRQAVIGGFVDSPPPTPEASEDKDDDRDAEASNAEDGGASFSSADERSTWYTYPLSLVTKREVVLDTRVVILIGGGLV